jgi:uncharacterized protein (TIGR02217 family)
MARAFRFKDWSEFWFSSDGSAIAPIGSINQFGTGDGATTIFGLYKTYSSGGVTRTRRIVKPVAGTVTIYKNGVLQTLTTDYSIDYSTGIVTFTAAPAAAAVLGCKGQFDVPCFFGSDYFNPGLNDAVSAVSYESLPLVEAPAAMFGLSV